MDNYCPCQKICECAFQHFISVTILYVYLKFGKYMFFFFTTCIRLCEIIFSQALEPLKACLRIEDFCTKRVFIIIIASLSGQDEPNRTL